MLNVFLLHFLNVTFGIHFQSESKVFNGHEKECSSPTEKLDRKESLKVGVPDCKCGICV